MRALQFITDHVIFKLSYNQIYQVKITRNGLNAGYLVFMIWYKKFSICPPVWYFLTKVLLWWVAHNENDKTFLRIDQVALSCPKIFKRAKVYRKKPSSNISLCRLQRFAHIKVLRVVEFHRKANKLKNLLSFSLISILQYQRCS